MINARAETVMTKPAFGPAFRRRRCLVLADGFFEWQRQGRTKQPFYIQLRNGAPFGFAALWECWRGKGGGAVESCTLLTTEPNELLRRVHNRMPVILERESHDLWLDHTVESAALGSLLRSYPAEGMTLYPVSRRVNDPKNDDAGCIEPLP
jgi:putative SOS response-associated peptidase YedK